MADKAFYTAWAEIAPDFSGFGRKVDQGFKDTLEPAGRKGGEDAGKGVQSGMLGAIGRIGGPLIAAFGALKLGEAIGSTIKDGILQANDLDQTVSAIRTVFGDASKDVEKFAQDAVQGLGITQQQALEASQMFGVFGKAAGLTGSDLSGFSNELGGLGADLAAFYGGDVQTALDAISAGLRGESEPLRQYGVLLDDATLKARAMSMGIFDGTGSLTQQQRVLAAQAEILAQTTDAQGQAAREAGTFDGQLKRLTAGWESVVTAIGQLFLPIATQAVGFLNNSVLPAVSGVVGALKILFQGNYDGGLFAALGLEEDSSGIGKLFELRDNLIKSVAEALPALIPVVVQGMSSLIATIVGIVPNIVQAVVSAVPLIVDALVTAIPLLVQGAVTLLTGLLSAVSILVPELVTAVIGLIPVIITALITMIPLLINGAIELFMAIVQAIPMIVTQLVQALVDLLPVLVNALGTLIPALINGAVSLFIAIVNAIPIIIPALINGIVDLLPTLISTIIGLIPILIQAAVQLFTALIDAIPVIIPALIDTIIEVGPKLVEAIIGIIPQLFDAGKAIIQGLIDGIGSMFGAIGDAVGGIMDYIGGFFPHSPAKRGPFSGSGWTGLKASGGALYDQFVSGFDGQDPTLPALPSLSTGVTIRRPEDLDALAGVGVAGASQFVQNNNFEHMDPEIAIEAAGQRAASVARRVRA